MALLEQEEGTIVMHMQESKHCLSSPASDAMLVQRTLQGDQYAFELLLQRYQGFVFHYSEQVLKDADLAADVSQQVFIRLSRALPTLRSDLPFKGWLFQVAHNCCIDAIRRRRRQALPFSSLAEENEGDDSSPLEGMADPGPLPDEEVEMRERHQLLWSAISKLPPKFRTIMTLRYALGMTFAEISQRLDIPESTAKTYAARAGALTACLECTPGCALVTSAGPVNEQKL